MQAFVLHQRKYLESSFLLDIFSAELGLIRGVWRISKNKKSSLAQSFCLLELELSGKKELKNVRSLVNQQNFMLQGKSLFCGMYLNELLLRLLPFAESNAPIFNAYVQTLSKLQNNHTLEPNLREFEQVLLRELGYELVLDFDANNQPIKADAYYQFEPILGFKLTQTNAAHNLILGADLLAIKASNWSKTQTLKTAKNIMRQALAPHLGNKALSSRNLFI